MSRSYKKTGARSITDLSDKWNRTRYHRDERRKVKDLCHNIKYNYTSEETDENSKFEYLSDKILNGKGRLIDYSICSSNKYTWASDGGTFWHDDLLTLRREFNEGAFCNIPNVESIWDRYVRIRNYKLNKKRSYMIVSCFYMKEIYNPQKYANITIDYYPIYKYWSIMLPYRSDHFFDNKILPEGAKEVRVKRFSETYNLNHKYDMMDYALLKAPTSLWSPIDLKYWLNAHREEIIKSVYKIRYNK